MTQPTSLVEQAVAHLNGQRFAEAAAAFLAAVNAMPADDEAWRGLALALALQGRLGDIIGLADYRGRRRGDGFLFCHEALGLLLTYKLRGHVKALDAALPDASVYKPSTLYQAACAHLLDGAEDAAFERLGRFKAMVAACPDLPIGADSHFNIAYRQGTLIEDAQFVDGLGDGDAVARRLPPRVDEGTPGSGERPYVLAVACDGRYFERFAPGFVASAARTMPGATLHFHVMEADEASRELFRRLAADAPDLVLNLSTEAASPFKSGAYYASARFLIGPELLRRYDRPLVLLDADVEFEQALDPLVAAAAGADFACFRHEGAGPCSRYPAVLSVTRPGEGGRDFLERVRRFVLAKLDIEWPFNWMLDQAAMGSVIRWAHKTPAAPDVGVLNDLVGTHYQPWLRSVGGEEKAALIRAASGR
ncbi:MAG TPA: hypothetical protein VKQ29_10580 [Aliidongia sp.]|nr:hypothetical protein [Aliidongia sp.]